MGDSARAHDSIDRFGNGFGWLDPIASSELLIAIWNAVIPIPALNRFVGVVDLDPPHPLARDHFTRRQHRLGVMNPETRIILDELNKRFTEHDAKWDSRFADQDICFSCQIGDLEMAQAARMEKLEHVTTSLDEWRPLIEGIVDDIKLDVSKSKLEVSKISCNWGCAILDQPATLLGVFTAAPTTVECPPLGAPAPMLNGHDVNNFHQENGYGVVSTLIPSLVKGMSPIPQPMSSVSVL